MNPLNLRIGIGHDIHRLGDEGPLNLGGIVIDHTKHLIGHSDADVLLHAITDAILGASSSGDIGELFPDTDSKNADKDSSEMLRAALQVMTEKGFEIINIDCIVFAQHPKLSPYKSSLQIKIADILNIAADCVGVKAKTGENVGPVGNEEAMMAQCVCLLYKSS